MTERWPCKYLTRPTECYQIGGGADPNKNVARTCGIRLCAWALESDAAVSKLEGAPIWMQRNAIGGHLWRDGDCEKCPAYEIGD